MGNIYHEWDGTTLIITSDSGTSSCDLKGRTGDTGVRGCQGIPGITLSGLELGETANTAFAGDRGVALENKTKELEEGVAAANVTSNYTGCYDWMNNYGWAPTNPCPMGFVTDVLMGQHIISSPTNSGYVNHGYGNGLVSILFRAWYRTTTDVEAIVYCPLTADLQLIGGKPVILNFGDFSVRVVINQSLIIESCELVSNLYAPINEVYISTEEPSADQAFICIAGAYGYGCWGA